MTNTLPRSSHARIQPFPDSTDGRSHLRSDHGRDRRARVVDPSKAPIPAATVTALNIDKKTERTTTSNDQGYYTLNSLDTLQLPDHRQEPRLPPARTLRVVARSLQSRHTAQFGAFMTEEKIADLPLNARTLRPELFALRLELRHPADPLLRLRLCAAVRTWQGVV
jgi:hypothetical protein